MRRLIVVLLSAALLTAVVWLLAKPTDQMDHVISSAMGETILV